MRAMRAGADPPMTIGLGEATAAAKSRATVPQAVDAA
jgi:hypothetical protein